MAIVGATRYLKSVAPAPANTPQDLTQQNCINLRLPTRDSLLAWELKKGRRELQVRVEGQLVFTSVYQMMDAALGGSDLHTSPRISPKGMSGPGACAGCWKTGFLRSSDIMSITRVDANRRGPSSLSWRR